MRAKTKKSQLYFSPCIQAAPVPASRRRSKPLALHSAIPTFLGLILTTKQQVQARVLFISPGTHRAEVMKAEAKVTLTAARMHQGPPMSSGSRSIPRDVFWGLPSGLSSPLAFRVLSFLFWRCMLPFPMRFFSFAGG